jgi:translation initiation factor IF-2
MSQDPNTKSENANVERPPVVVIMGHIDHGKSTLLDFIRNSNIVAKEAGGITQHLGAYEISHKNSDEEDKKITFIDTPGHSAFCGVRSRGAKVADIAILIISAEDGVMPQTMEAYECIKSDGIPFIVAINKIDSPKANVEKVKNDLVEKEIYIEGYGGDIPAVEISALKGDGVNDLLDLILIASEVEGLKADIGAAASGFVIEAHKDDRKGLSATLIIKNGTLNAGQFVACHKAFSPVRIFEDHNNKPIKTATVSKPVKICGWNDFPVVGAEFASFNTKKEAEAHCSANKDFENTSTDNGDLDSETFTIPIIIKSDTHGSIEAVEHELEKITTTNSQIQITNTGTGNVSEVDVKKASGNENSIIVGFGIDVDRQAEIMSERLGTPIKTFKVIYDLVEWLEAEIENKRPRIEVDEITGKAKILKNFSETKNTRVLGGRVIEGKIKLGGEVKILRRGEEIGRGKIKELQSQKAKATEVEEGTEFGLCLETKLDIVPADEIETFQTVEK